MAVPSLSKPAAMPKGLAKSSPIICCAKIRAGASLVQLYTGLVYEGPGLVTRMKRDLAARLRADGFAHIEEAIGSDVKETK